MVPTAMARERLCALRETISRIENRNASSLRRSTGTAEANGFSRRQTEMHASERPVLAFGVPELDHILEGGLPLAGLSEIRTQQTRDSGAATGFLLGVAALCQERRRDRGMSAPVLWIAQPMAGLEAGRPYAVGLQAYGLATGHLLLADPRTLEDALWIAEAALDVAAFAAVILEVRGNPAGLGLGESRRLHVRARAGRLPLLLFRQAGEEEASSAVFRLQVRPAPARPRLLPDGSFLDGSIGSPVFRITPEKSRIPSSSDILVEWNAHDRQFRPFEPDAIAFPADAAHSIPHIPLSAQRQAGANALGKLLAFPRAS